MSLFVSDVAKCARGHRSRDQQASRSHDRPDPAKRAELRERGLERAKKYSVEAIAKQYREFYRWLAEQPLDRHV